MNTNTVSGTCGSNETPCDVITADDCGGTWYCVRGSCNVNYTLEPVEDGVDVELLEDNDCFTMPEGIDSEAELEAAVNA